MTTRITSRPAETGSAAGTIGLLIAYVCGVDDTETILLIGSGLGLLPAVITTLVNNGGIVGIVKLLVKGRST